ncbi:hypothetical protein SLITO_v1c04750 [Spiroplasma litorale]|uniref:Transmembrane protein n=1 Tax=Spiroplasma litorale TaxID=216942 RepID=A0A0K1W1R9_9MOLU|nr:hypothetical protein [Spiroplasma litorale]AKX34128.1 hypothetical protein SLITO_v1c04750 [Spiroplasma litorale]
MSNIKILKENRKSVFMITSLMIFAFIMVIFSLTMLFSPIINMDNINNINSFFNENYSLFMSLFYKYNDYPIFVVKSDPFLIVWLPLITGSIIIALLIWRIILHTIGYKTKNRKGNSTVVRPIRSYQITMILCWFFMFFLIIVATLSYLSASPFLTGATWYFDLSNGAPSLTEESIKHIASVLEGQFSQCYWLSFAWFSSSNSAILTESTVFNVWMWILMPFILQIIFIVLSFIGTICGECSWGTINKSVLRDIDMSSEGNVKISNNLSKKLIEKKVDLNRVSSSELQARILLFYKNFIKLLESSNNTNIPIYKEARLSLEKYSVIEKINWKKIGNYVEGLVEWYTSTDQRFVNLISQLATNPKHNLFINYKKQLLSLIGEYQSAINKWNLLDAEFKIEQIFALTFERDEILAKVGYCLKTRLNSNFDSYDKKDAYINMLEQAKNNRDYHNYRQICIKLIKKMSPEKVAISDFINQVVAYQF